MDCPRRSDQARDLRAPRRPSAGGRRARRRAAGQPTRRLAAPQGAEGRGPGGRPARRQPAHLPAQRGRGRRPPRPARPVLEPGLGGLQVGRRAINRGGLMSTQAAETSVRTQIVVEAPVERAFSVFTEDFGSFKPREHNLLEVEIAETVFEPREGGHLYDRGVDGSECRWARVLAYEPPDRVVISWDINPQWQIETDLEKTSEVEVRFISETPERTRVELEHRKLDRHGDGWEGVREGVGGEGGWPLYLRRFAQQL